MHGRRTIHVGRAGGVVTFASASLAASVAWALPYGTPMRALPSLVLQADPDDIVDYGNRCATALGKEVPNWDCVRDGGVVNRYDISAAPCPGAVFTGFSDVCTGTDQCIEETWLDTILTANFDAAPP